MPDVVGLQRLLYPSQGARRDLTPGAPDPRGPSRPDPRGPSSQGARRDLTPGPPPPAVAQVQGLPCVKRQLLEMLVDKRPGPQPWLQQISIALDCPWPHRPPAQDDGPGFLKLVVEDNKLVAWQASHGAALLPRHLRLCPAGWTTVCRNLSDLQRACKCLASPICTAVSSASAPPATQPQSWVQGDEHASAITSSR